MMRIASIALIVSIVLAPAPAQGQVVQNPLLVGNQSQFNALDLYDGSTGAYIRPFAGNGTGPPSFSYFRYGGLNNNLFVQRGNDILQFNGLTGNFVNVFSTTQLGGIFTFGADTNMYRLEPFSSTQFNPPGIGRYSGVNGNRLGTFVSPSGSGIGGAATMRVGPTGDLFVSSDNTILRFNGTTGAPMGAFTPPGSGGLGAITEALFTSSGKLLAVGVGANTSDKVFQFDGATGAYLGLFASGNGLNGAHGLAEGPDGSIFVGSISGSSIKRFDQGTGAFLGDFVTTTAHLFPSTIAFAPFPIPEPSSLLLAMLLPLGATIGRYRAGSKNRRNGPCL